MPVKILLNFYLWLAETVTQDFLVNHLARLALPNLAM